MKQKLESKVNEETFFQRFKHGIKRIIPSKRLIAGATFATFLATTPVAGQSLKNYIEPKIGVISPVAEKEQDYKPSFLIGGAYGVNIRKVGFEAGLDYFHSSGEYIETHSILPRLNVSYYPLKPVELNMLEKSKTVKVKPYVMAGMNFLSEFSAIDIPEFGVHDNVSNTTFGLEFGIGATIFDRIHGRLSYTVMPASENVEAMITLTGGYRFLIGGKK